MISWGIPKAKAFSWCITDSQARKRGEQKGSFGFFCRTEPICFYENRCRSALAAERIYTSAEKFVPHRGTKTSFFCLRSFSTKHTDSFLFFKRNLTLFGYKGSDCDLKIADAYGPFQWQHWNENLAISGNSSLKDEKIPREVVCSNFWILK